MTQNGPCLGGSINTAGVLEKVRMIAVVRERKKRGSGDERPSLDNFKSNLKITSSVSNESHHHVSESSVSVSLTGSFVDLRGRTSYL